MKKVQNVRQAHVGQKTKLQKFEYREVHRSQIKTAAYNPRTISEVARKALDRGIDDFGCVEPLVWNEKTGNLVGGHQRLIKLDKEEGYKERAKHNADYMVGVSVVSLTLQREKKLNVLLNAPGAQGFFDQEALFDLLSEFKESELGDMGMSRMDLELDFGTVPDFMQTPDAMTASDEATNEVERQLQSIKDRKRKAKADAKTAPNADADYYLMVVFPSRKKKLEFLDRVDQPYESIFFEYEEWQLMMNKDRQRNRIKD
jgi:hypothetical protein